MSELDSVKALLDAHLSSLRLEMQRLATNYDAITKTVQSIENNTNVAIAEIRKDINNLGSKVEGNNVEIKAIKQRIEISEDVQQGKWSDQAVLNNAQKTINENSKSKSDRVTALLFGAIATFVTLFITALWNVFFAK